MSGRLTATRPINYTVRVVGWRWRCNWMRACRLHTLANRSPSFPTPSYVVLQLCFKKLGLEPIIMSAGELEHEWAGTPGKLIRDRYRWG